MDLFMQTLYSHSSGLEKGEQQCACAWRVHLQMFREVSSVKEQKRDPEV